MKIIATKVKQDLIEIIGDYLDSYDLKASQVIEGVKDPLPPEESELHIRMAQAATSEFVKTMVKI